MSYPSARQRLHSLRNSKQIKRLHFYQQLQLGPGTNASQVHQRPVSLAESLQDVQLPTSVYAQKLDHLPTRVTRRTCRRSIPDRPRHRKALDRQMAISRSCRKRPRTLPVTALRRAAGVYIFVAPQITTLVPWKRSRPNSPHGHGIGTRQVPVQGYPR